MRFRINLIEFGEHVFLFYFAPRRMVLVNIFTLFNFSSRSMFGNLVYCGRCHELLLKVYILRTSLLNMFIFYLFPRSKIYSFKLYFAVIYVIKEQFCRHV